MTSNCYKVEQIQELLILPERWPLPILCEGKGATVIDIEGKEYIDCHAGPGVLSLGHCNRELIDALKDQLDKLLFCSAFLHQPLMTLAKTLSGILPGSLSKFYLVNSGLEAVEGAVKLAKKYSYLQGKNGTCMVSLQNSFHGLTSLTLTLTGMGKFKKGLGSFANSPIVMHIPAPYCYRCNQRYPGCDLDCAFALERCVKIRGADDIAAIIYEPVLGSGGIIVPPDEYHQTIRKISRDYGILLILDEIFTGFGRTGKMFASQHWGIEPEIMTTGKGMGGGFPVGAFMATREVADSFEPGDHGGTFCGNPLACTAVAASIEIIQKYRLDRNASIIGSLILEELGRLKEMGKLKGDVRGLGLAIGIELVKDEKNRTPATLRARKLAKDLLKEGILVKTTGPEDNVIRINPPLTISEEEAHKVVKAVGKCL